MAQKLAQNVFFFAPVFLVYLAVCNVTKNHRDRGTNTSEISMKKQNECFKFDFSKFWAGMAENRPKSF